jgi:hypothetical protein
MFGYMPGTEDRLKTREAFETNGQCLNLVAFGQWGRHGHHRGRWEVDEVDIGI